MFWLSVLSRHLIKSPYQSHTGSKIDIFYHWHIFTWFDFNLFIIYLIFLSIWSSYDYHKIVIHIVCLLCPIKPKFLKHRQCLPLSVSHRLLDICVLALCVWQLWNLRKWRYTFSVSSVSTAKYLHLYKLLLMITFFFFFY